MASIMSISLRTRILITASVVALLFVVTTVYFAQRAKQELLGVVKDNAIGLLDAAQYHVESEYNSILYHKTAMTNRRKHELQNNIDIAYATIKTRWEKAQEGLITEKEAKTDALETIRQMRYDGGSGYFWITNSDHPYPLLLMHSTQQELDGTVTDDPIYNCALGKNENLFKAMVETCLKQGDGYVDYLWPKPTPQGLSKNRLPKISYVRIFKPWNWIIGTGLYVDDIERDEQNRLQAVVEVLNKTLVKQKIGDSGDFFIFDNNKRIIVHPDYMDEEPSLTHPETKDKLLEELMKTAHTPSQSMEYMEKKPGDSSDTLHEKIAFVSCYEPLGWYIACSIYKDDFEQVVSQFTRSMLFYSGTIVGIALFLSLLVSRNITNPLQILTHSIGKTDEDGIPEETASITGIREIQDLSGTINNMVESIQQFRQDIRTRNAELEEFTYIASHDLQEPLRKLVSFCGLLEMDIGGDLSPQAQKDMDFIKDAALRMQRLIQDLLILSRVGNREIECNKVSLSTCADNALRILEKDIQQSNVSLLRDPLPELTCDPMMITDLYVNLVENALKYSSTSNSPRIVLTCREEEHEYILGVQDNGIGIKSEYLKLVFTPFKRLHGRSEYTGSGIGLAICRKIVERHQGRIWVESILTEGSHFLFSIPKRLTKKCSCHQQNVNLETQDQKPQQAEPVSPG